MPSPSLRLEPPPRAPSTVAVQTVLVVDDSRLQRKVLASYLTRLGLAVIEAGSGEEALAIHALHPVDLIISDWMMPGMDGIGFCRAFRGLAHEQYVYFILLTSKSEKDEIAVGLDAGADDFLAKPVGLHELRARINAAGRILRMERELHQRNRIATAALSELRELYDSIDHDLIEARKLQQSLVRERRRCFNEGEVNLLLQPSGHVGGDLVGFYRAGEAHLGLFAIDVSGHGIASALLTARLAAYLTGNSPSHNMALGYDAGGQIVAHPPEAVARRLNQLMLDEVDTGHYFTMILASIDLPSGRVELVQAGHPPPLIQGRDGLVRQVGDGGMPIGLLPDAIFGRVDFALAPGERLLICSDGFSECPSREGALLEDSGLIGLIRARHDLRGSALLEALVWDLAAYSDDQDFTDDLSAVLFEYSGSEKV